MLTSEPTSAARRAYAICTNCIMDTSDSGITFDARGRCDYCANFHANILPNWHPNEVGAAEIAKDIEAIRRHGRGKDHDCLIGISGGVDSSYLAYIAKVKFGLRPLLFHVDAGWNSQAAVNNIEKMVTMDSGLDLHTEVIDWQKSLPRTCSSPSSRQASLTRGHAAGSRAFFGGLYSFAAKHGFAESTFSPAPTTRPNA